MTWLDFIALSLAAGGVVDVWKNGSIFALARAVAADAAETDAVQNRRTVRGLLGELLSCEFCLSHHTPWLLAVLFLLPALVVTGPLAFLLKLPVYSLAATRLGWLLNAAVPADCRYDRAAQLPETLSQPLTDRAIASNEDDDDEDTTNPGNLGAPDN